MREVSLADLGSQLKSTFITLGCLGVVGLIFGFVGTTVTASGVLPDVHIPNVVWIAALIGMYVWIATSERSYHEWAFSFWFPRLGFMGWLTVTAYLTAIVQSFRYSAIFPVGIQRGVAVATIWIVLVVPGVLFLSLCQAGYERLIAKREDAMAAKVA